MTIYIAHRGNINGQNPDFENKIDYLNNAINLNYGVEFDVMFYKNGLYLGHDEPQEKLELNLIHKPNTFVHAKDLNALELLLKLDCNVFWHETDKITITNKGFIWCFPGVFVNSNLAVWLDLHNKSLPNTIGDIYGVCGDNASILDK